MTVGRFSELVLRALPLADSIEEALAAAEVAMGIELAQSLWEQQGTTEHGMPRWVHRQTGEKRYQRQRPRERGTGETPPVPSGKTGSSQEDLPRLASDILKINQPDRRTALPPFIPQVYDRLHQKYPNLTESAFHDVLHRLAALDLLTLQVWGGGWAEDLQNKTGFTKERFPEHPRHGRAAWIQFRPDAAQRISEMVERPAPAISAPASAATRYAPTVANFVRRLGKERGANIASLVDVRRLLAEAGLDRAGQDAAINEARRLGFVTGSPFEGRHGVSEEERAAALPERDASPIGFLHLKGAFALEDVPTEPVPDEVLETPSPPSTAPSDPPAARKDKPRTKRRAARRRWKVRRRRQHLGAVLSAEMAANPSEWSRYKTRTGRVVWQNARTGQVRYQGRQPGSRDPVSRAKMATEEAFGSEPPGPGWTSAGHGRWVRDTNDALDLPKPKPGPRIAIVGGGPGGLFTTYLLNQRFPDANLTLFEASDRLGGKVMTDCFSDGTCFEAGVAELYEYKGDSQDPLRQLIEEDLGLPTANMSGGGVVLDGHVLRDLDDLEKVFGHDSRKRIEAFHRRCAELMPLEKYARRWQPDNDHPWAKCCFRDCIRDEVDRDPVACAYIETACHSDLATEPRTCNGLNGIKNVLLDNDEYMQLYHVKGGIERVVMALKEKIDSRVCLGCRATMLQKEKSEYRLTWRCDGEDCDDLFDLVVLALPNHWLEQLRLPDAQLNEAVHALLAHYDLPAHYLRVSLLFEKNWWSGMKMPGEFWMQDIGGGCCVYDEDARWGSERKGKGHVLSFLLAGGDALLQCSSNDTDGQIVERLLESLPPFMREPAEESLVEVQVDRFVGAVNAQPGGLPVPELRGEHQPEPAGHHGVFICGDFMFDSTLNAALISAATAVDLLLAQAGVGGEKGTAAVKSLGRGTD